MRQTPKICTLREDAGGAVLVANLEEFKVASAGEMLAHLSAGSAHRAVGGGGGDGGGPAQAKQTCQPPPAPDSLFGSPFPLPPW